MNGNDTQDPNSALGRLARWVCGFDPAAIPEPVLDKAKLHLLDALACAFAGRDEVAAVGAINTVRALGGVPDCTVIGTPERTSLANAVLANGVLVRCLDLNDLDSSSGFAGHPSDNIVVGLAVGERLEASGRDLLADIVLGYELYCRMPRVHLAGQWHRSTTSGVVAAVMAGWLMRLPEDRLAHAIALSIPYCNALRVGREDAQLTAPKNISNAMVAHTALVATLLAAEGLTGPPTALDDWSKGVMGGADLSVLTEPPEYRIMKVGFKAHPAIGTSQAMIEATLEARAALNPAERASVELIDVLVADTPFTRRQVQEENRGNPETREAADHSFPFLVAVAFLDGELTLRQFANDRWFDPTVRSLMANVHLRAEPALNAYLPGFPATVRVKTSSREHLVEMPHAPGHPNNPMDFSRASAKFRRFSDGHIEQSQQDAIIESVGSLETVSSVRELMRLLAVK